MERLCKHRWKIAAIGLSALATVWMLGCESSDPAWSSPTSTLSPSATMAAARVAQGGKLGSSLGQGVGISMQPVYGNNTVFLITPIAFDDLKPGMNVAYRNPFGQQVVHTLQYKQDGYWVIEGINNPGPDAYHVTRDNLVGVVYGSFQSNQPAPNPDQ